MTIAGSPWQKSGRRVATRAALLLALWLAVSPANYLPANDANNPADSGSQIPPSSLPRRIFPSDSPQLASSPVNPLSSYSIEPAPMGIADFGLGPSGAYQYSTNSFLGIVYISALSTSNSTGGTDMSFQLNVNLHFTSNNTPYVYWIQDVAVVVTSSGYIYFDDNIWNSSAKNAAMSASAVSGRGGVYQSSAGSYYGVFASPSSPGNGIYLKYPVTVYFRVNSTVGASGKPQVTFEYNDGLGWVTYDVVTFVSVSRLTSLGGFVVNGFSYNPVNFDDAEVIMGGAHSGYKTSDVQSDVRIQLEYWNGHNYQMVENAFNFGADTAEGISNVRALYYYYPGNGEIISQISQGSGQLGTLYYQTQVGIVDVKAVIPSGVLYVRNYSNPAATPSQYSFTNGEAIVVIYPGNYFFRTYQGASLYRAGHAAFSAGQSIQAVLNQVGLTLSYSVIGGGSGYSGPTFTYTSSGGQQAAVLEASPVTYYVDIGTQWSASGSLPGSSASERWATNRAGSTANASQTINFAYYHQYSIMATYNLVGGGTPSAPPTFSYSTLGATSLVNLNTSTLILWVDSGSSYAASNPLQGSTSRERWYSTAVGGTVSAAVFLTLVYTHQYYLSVTGAGPSSRWYDSGSTAIIGATGVYNRTSGVGQRFVSYSIDGGASTGVPPTRGAFNMSVHMDAPHALAFSSVTQYQLSLGSGAQQSLVSITEPPIAGDQDWYDTGAQVKLTGNYVVNEKANQSRTNVVGYVLDRMQTTLPRQGNGTFAVNLIADRPHKLDVLEVTQYHLTVSGGSGVVIHRSSPTADGFFDAGSSASITTSRTWSVQGQSRQNLVAYALDGATTNTPRESVANFSTPAVTFNTAHILVFNSVTQYLTSFRFVAGSTNKSIVPTNFQITTQGLGTIDARVGSAWLDSGSTVKVISLVWENIDIKPDNFTLLVSGPSTATLHAKVYDAALRVTDSLGLPVSDARAEIVLANDTRLTRSTAGDGTIRLRMIPLGTFQASVSGLGQSTQVSGNGSVEETTQVHLFLSYPVLGMAVGLILIISALAFVLRRKRSPNL